MSVIVKSKIDNALQNGRFTLSCSVNGEDPSVPPLNLIHLTTNITETVKDKKTEVSHEHKKRFSSKVTNKRLQNFLSGISQEIQDNIQKGIVSREEIIEAHKNNIPRVDTKSVSERFEEMHGAIMDSTINQLPSLGRNEQNLSEAVLKTVDAISPLANYFGWTKEGKISKVSEAWGTLIEKGLGKRKCLTSLFTHYEKAFGKKGTDDIDYILSGGAKSNKYYYTGVLLQSLSIGSKYHSQLTKNIYKEIC